MINVIFETIDDVFIAIDRMEQRHKEELEAFNRLPYLGVYSFSELCEMERKIRGRHEEEFYNYNMIIADWISIENEDQDFDEMVESIIKKQKAEVRRRNREIKRRQLEVQHEIRSCGIPHEITELWEFEAVYGEILCGKTKIEFINEDDNKNDITDREFIELNEIDEMFLDYELSETDLNYYVKEVPRYSYLFIPA